MKCVLTQSGLVNGSNDESYLLSNILKEFYSETRGRRAYYDKEKGILTIKIEEDIFDIKFNPKQKTLFEGKATIDPNIRKLQKLVLNSEKRQVLKKVKKEIREGIYPTDGKAISIYAESLDKELVKTGATAVKDVFLAAWPFLLIGATIPAWIGISYTDFSKWREVYQVMLGFSLVGLDLTGGVAALLRLIFRFVGDPSYTYEEALDSLKELKVTLKKRHDLRIHLKELEKRIKKESFSEFLQREDIKDDAKTKEYKDQFFNEFNNVLINYEKLPLEKKSQYCLQLSNLLTEYQKKVNALHDKKTGEIVLGEARDVYQIFIDLLPALNDISFSITKELNDIKEKNRFNSEVRHLQQSLSEKTNSPSIVTEELGDSAVQYQKMG